MLFAGIFVLLFLLELLYFKIADRYNIIDKPNLRSSHTIVTLRGGGVIFVLGSLLFFLIFGFKYPSFIEGLLAISIVSFFDDVKPQAARLRMLAQFAAVALLIYEVGIFHYEWYWWLLAFILVTGVINAYNFMDGINGITTAYSFTVLGGLYFVNKALPPKGASFHQELLICLALANLVFAFFNFRKKAKCFAGDVGSVSMAFSLLFLTAWCIKQTFNPIFVLFFAVYGIDTVFTIIQRLYKRENIFDAHRQHLYQYLANEEKIPQLVVSFIYAVIQMLVTAGTVLVWCKPAHLQWLFTIATLGLLAGAYIVIKTMLLKKYKIGAIA